MKSKVIKLFSICLLVVLISFPCALYVNANSAPHIWGGMTSTGAVITGESCPIIVESELLTFNISDFPPDPSAEDTEADVNYGSVTAEYHFYNPTNEEITATLVFPFGTLPGYVDSDDVNYPETNKYEITSNGVSVEKTLRHTYGTYLDFSLDADLEYICDKYIKNDFFSPQTCVTVYKYKVNASEEDYYCFETTFDCYPSKTRFFLKERYGGVTSGGNDIEFEVNVDTENDDTFELVFFGEAPDGDFVWTRSDKRGKSKDKNATVIFKKEETEIITFEEYVFRNYDTNSGILRQDWYNAALSFFTETLDDCELSGRFEQDFTSKLFRWYEYDLTFAPKERLTNVVTAPIYPEIDGTYTPFIYTYTYLLSPAGKWADFGSLNVVINTPFYLTDSALPGFEKTENGYTATFDKLPENELVFCLSESNSPEKNKSIFGFLWVAYFLLFQFCGPIPFFAMLIIVGGIIALIVVLIKKRRKNTKNNTSS